MKDIQLVAARSQVRLALMAMEQRRKILAKLESKLSRHYNRVAHTEATIILMEELLGMMLQDPDHWDDEPELVPF